MQEVGGTIFKFVTIEGEDRVSAVPFLTVKIFSVFFKKLLTNASQCDII